MTERSGPPMRAALVLGCLAFVLYALTSPPGITWRHDGEDGAEFAAVGRVFGVAHPTGYPLYTLLLRLASLGANENAWRATLLSNVAGAVAVFLVTLLFFEIARRAASSRRAALAGSIATAALFAVSPLWWSQSIIIEVYALHMAFVAAAFWLALRFRGGARVLWILAYLSGLAMAHHLQFVLAAPSLAILLLAGWVAGRRTDAGPGGFPSAGGDAGVSAAPGRVSPASLLIPAVLLSLVPITLYLVLFFRSRHDPALDWGNPESGKQLFWVMRGEQYRFRMFTSKAPEVMKRAVDFLSGKFPPQFGWSVLPLGLFGIVLLARRAKALLAALLLFAALQLAFTVNYAIPDPDAYFLPLVLVWAGLIAAGLTGIAERVPSRGGLAVLLALVLAGPVFAFPGHWKLLSLTKETEAEDYSRSVISSLPPRSLVLADGDGRTFGLWYRLAVSGRKDVTVIYRALLVWPWYRANVAERDTAFRLTVEGRPLAETSRHVFTDNWDHRPVYSTYVDRWVGLNFRVRPEGRVFRVLGLRREWRSPQGPVRWKPIDIAAAANADYRFDPFTPGSTDSSGLFPGLGGGAMYWGTLPLMMARPQAKTGRPSVFTTARQPQASATFPLAPDPTTMICLLVDGGAIGHASLRLGEARVNYAEGPSDTVEVRSYENVWEFAAESYEITLPEDVTAWNGPRNQSLTVLPILTDPGRRLVSLELTGEGPIGEGGEAAGYTVFAASQVLAN